MFLVSAVSLQQDEFRTNHFYFLLVTIPVFYRYAQNTVRPCSCGDQAVTHMYGATSHDAVPLIKKTVLTLLLLLQVMDPATSFLLVINPRHKVGQLYFPNGIIITLQAV